MHLLTCEHVAAGIVPDWCCRKWRPEWGWCCTRPLPPPSCRCPSGRAAEPATAAASPPWSLTGWRPWCWEPGRSEWRRARCHVRKFNLFGFFALGQVDSPSLKIGRCKVSWQAQTLTELTVTVSCRKTITSSWETEQSTTGIKCVCVTGIQNRQIIC